MQIGGKFCQKGTYSKIYLDVVDFGPEKVDFELGMVDFGGCFWKGSNSTNDRKIDSVPLMYFLSLPFKFWMEAKFIKKCRFFPT